MKRNTGLWVALAMALQICTMQGQADDVAVAGRKILAANQDAVLKIQVVIQQKMLMNGTEGNAQESKSEATGTVLDPSGLMLVSLSSVDPSKLTETMMKNFGQGRMKMEMKTVLKDLKIILPDESEVDAEVVLRDRDWDMAFIRPKQKPAQPLTAVNLRDASKPGVLDEMILLRRLDKVASHTPAAAAARIAAIVQKPRTFYMLETAEAGVGTPVFSLDGKLAGIVLLRVVESEGGGGISAMLGGAGGMGISPVILPAADILEASQQAASKPAKETTIPATPAAEAAAAAPPAKAEAAPAKPAKEEAKEQTP